MAQDHIRDMLGHLIMVGDLPHVINKVCPLVDLFPVLGSDHHKEILPLLRGHTLVYHRILRLLPQRGEFNPP